MAEKDGGALNQFINVAVAEKVSALRTEEYFRERSARAAIVEAKRIAGSYRADRYIATSAPANATAP